jgi:hypothetical protein
MLKKPLVIATVAATLGMAVISTQASAGDPVLGAIIGGGIGAAIGHNAGGHNATAVGGVLGAIVGSSIAAQSGGYYDRGYYEGGYAPAPAPVYDYGPSYGPAYGYAPAYGPAYYAPAPVVVYSSGSYYRGHSHRVYDHGYDRGYYQASDRHNGHGDHRR